LTRKLSAGSQTNSRNQIDLGQRLTEILKQSQFKPMSVAQQVVVIYAVSNGFASDIAPKDIRVWEEKLHDFFEKSKQSLLESIGKGAWDEKVEGELKAALGEFKKV
jgi:F-type H+-transporting ATPase subunit alpha